MTEQVKNKQADSTADVLPEDKTATALPKKVEITPQEAVAATRQRVKDDKKVEDEDGVRTLAAGLRVKLHPVAANIMVEAQARIPEPTIPTFKNKTTGKDEPNPGSPTYLAKMVEVKALRAQATLDALQLFGVELLQPIPPKNDWLQKLEFLKLISKEECNDSSIDENNNVKNEFLRELFYKKFVIVDAATLNELGKISGVTEEMVASARKSFPSN